MGFFGLLAVMVGALLVYAAVKGYSIRGLLSGKIVKA